MKGSLYYGSIRTPVNPAVSVGWSVPSRESIRLTQADTGTLQVRLERGGPNRNLRLPELQTSSEGL